MVRALSFKDSAICLFVSPSHSKSNIARSLGESLGSDFRPEVQELPVVAFIFTIVPSKEEAGKMSSLRLVSSSESTKNLSGIPRETS
jgi:hypothetical protein